MSQQLRDAAGRQRRGTVTMRQVVTRISAQIGQHGIGQRLRGERTLTLC